MLYMVDMLNMLDVLNMLNMLERLEYDECCQGVTYLRGRRCHTEIKLSMTHVLRC